MADKMLTFNGKTISGPSGTGIVIVKEPEPTLPPRTLRFQFSKSDYDPIDAGVGSSGTWTKVDSTTLNIWDWTKSSISFHTAFSKAFADSDNFVSIIAAGDTSAVTSMRAMFQNCTSLTSIPLFDTSAVTDMGSMFRNCTSLTSIPLFDTSAVTDMSFMFRGCTLTSVPLFDTSKVTNMNSMFLECHSLTSIPLFKMSSVTTMDSCFKNCTSLASVPIFDTSSVTNMGSLFSGCTSLTHIPLFDTSKVTVITYAFSDCIKVESGALAIYHQVSTQAVPPSAHYNTFTDCGKNTETGMEELAQIPTDWGGTMTTSSNS